MSLRICERSSFTQAAEDPGMPRATLTHSLNKLEAWLGTRLLKRSTRWVKRRSAVHPAQYPPPAMPVSVLYPYNRHMSARVRFFVGRGRGMILR